MLKQNLNYETERPLNKGEKKVIGIMKDELDEKKNYRVFQLILKSFRYLTEIIIKIKRKRDKNVCHNYI